MLADVVNFLFDLAFVWLYVTSTPYPHKVTNLRYAQIYRLSLWLAGVALCPHGLIANYHSFDRRLSIYPEVKLGFQHR